MKFRWKSVINKMSVVKHGYLTCGL